MGGDKMSVRPFRLRALSVVLSGLVLSACVPFDLGGLRPELAQPLALAQAFYLRGDKHDAQHSVSWPKQCRIRPQRKKTMVARVAHWVESPTPAANFVDQTVPAPTMSSYLPPGQGTGF